MSCYYTSSGMLLQMLVVSHVTCMHDIPILDLRYETGNPIAGPTLTYVLKRFRSTLYHSTPHRR